MKKILILLIVLSFFSCNNERGIKVVSGKVNSINAIVDPRVELMSIIQYLAEDKNINNTDSVYKQKADEHFKAYKNHEVITFYKVLNEKGFSYDAPPTFMLYLTQKLDKDNGKIDESYKTQILTRIGGIENEEKFIKLLKDFSEKSKFSKFYAENSDFYKKIIEEYSRQNGVDYIKFVEDFYGKEQNSYNSLLVTLYKGNYGPRIKEKNSSYDIYNIMAPRGSKENIPMFRNDILFHELSHSYINPLTDKYYDKVWLYEDLFNPVSSRMNKMAYGTWETTVNEHLVRAADIIMSEKAFGKMSTFSRIQEEIANGFIYIEPIIKSLREYESNREKYKTLEEFYPELIDSFSKYGKARTVKKQDSYTGTVESMFTNMGDITIIVSSKEKNKISQLEIENLAYRLKNYWTKISGLKVNIIYDSDYNYRYDNDNLVIIGTYEGNKFFKNNKSTLPFSIEQEKIIIGNKEVKETNLKFIGVFANPKNSKRGILVFTGQNIESLKGILEISNLNIGYFIIQGKKILGKGRF